jgi:F-type H+-transporting ATPase subunit gamma
MATSSREIKGRIRSVKNTKQITRAMQLVAASKMRRAQERALTSRDYATRALELLRRVSTSAMPVAYADHPLLTERPVARVGVVLFTSSRGLAGGYNANVIKKMLELVGSAGLAGDAATLTKEQIDIIAIGKKGEQAARKAGYTVVSAFPDLSDAPTAVELGPIADALFDGFTSTRFDRVVLVYTHFASTLVQVPRVKQLLPVKYAEIEALLNDAVTEQTDAQIKGVSEYALEPTPEAVLTQIFRALADVQIYQALLEARASEHASRMMAMKSASDNAGKLMGELTLSYNQARQAAITREIAEIAAGTSAQE